MNFKSIICALVLVSVFLPKKFFAQTTIAIPISQDSYVDSDSTTVNYGGDTIAYAGVFNSPSQHHRRTYFYFDLTQIPVGKRIYSALIHAPYYNRTTNIGGTTYKTYLATDTWHEDTITYSNQPDYAWTGGQWLAFSSDTCKITVGALVQQMYYGMSPNNGFVVALVDETDTADTYIDFYTKEASDSTMRPWLEVTYYDPIAVSNVNIVHESTDGAGDAEISFTPIGGSGNFSYTWYDGYTGNTLSGDTLIDSLNYGWYGVKITDNTLSQSVYQAFIVGISCDTVSITYRTWPNYTESAYITNVLNGSGVDEANSNYGGSSAFVTAYQNSANGWYNRMSLMKFDLFIDQNTSIQQADMTSYGTGHLISSYRTNEADWIKITEDWLEYYVTYNNQPDTSSSVFAFVDSVSTTNENKRVDLVDLFEFWRDEPDSNFGMYFRLEDFTTQYQVKQQYYSDDASDTTKHPVIDFQFIVDYPSQPLICNPNLLSYKNLQRHLDGSYASTREGVIRFAYKEEYQVDTSQYLTVNLYDGSHVLIASCDHTGTTTGGLTAIKYNFDDNRYAFDVSGVTGITQNKYYILEIENSKGDKRYLRFLYQY